MEPLSGLLPGLDLTGIDRVIVGGESGPGARPMSLAWVAEIRDQCVEAGVAFFFKQWGGVNKSRTGRELDGRTWNQMPGGTEPEPSGRFALAVVWKWRGGGNAADDTAWNACYPRSTGLLISPTRGLIGRPLRIPLWVAGNFFGDGFPIFFSIHPQRGGRGDVQTETTWRGKPSEAGRGGTRKFLQRNYSNRHFATRLMEKMTSESGGLWEWIRPDHGNAPTSIPIIIFDYSTPRSSLFT